VTNKTELRPDPVLVEYRGAIAHVTLNRPHALNALSVDLEDRLIEILEQVAADDDVQVIVLRGAGRAFSAGADLKERQEGTAPDVDSTLDAYHNEAAFMRLWGIDKVVVAAVHGYCLGGSNHLAGLADITIAVDDTELGDPEIRFGNPLLVPIMMHLVGVKAARKLLYLGEFITGEEAADLGLVSMAVSGESFDAVVEGVAERLATIPRAGLVQLKRAFNYATERAGMRTAGAINAELLGMTFAVMGTGGPVPESFSKSGAAAPDTPPSESTEALPVYREDDPARPREPLIVDTAGDIRVLTLNRPEVRNALSPELLARLDAEIAAAVADQRIAAIVITGVGTAFSAGIDLKIPVEEWPYPEDYDHQQWLLRRCMSIWDAPKPIIAAVNGHALGHACDLTAVCDFTVASTEATFGVPEVRHLGGVAAMVYPYLMPMKLGRRFLYLGEAWGAEQAKRAGLVTEVVAAEELISASLDLARRLATIPPAALRQMKRAVNRSYDIMGLRDTLAYNVESLTLAISTMDPQELAERDALIKSKGLTAFIRERDRPFEQSVAT
jgi:enoyl-CoA hydratase